MKKLVLLAVACALIVVGIVLFVALGTVRSGPPPLGTGNDGTGLQCESNTIGQPVTVGIFALENNGSHAVRISAVMLSGGQGQKMASPAYLVPIRDSTLLGAQPWPPAGAAWKLRQLAAGGQIAPHAALNLVFAQERTSDRTRPAAVQVTYTADGRNYSLTEAVRVVVAANC